MAYVIPIRVLVADDSRIIREAVLRLLGGDSDIRAVAQAGSFTQTLQLVGELHPTVVLMDLHMRDENAVLPPEIKESLSSTLVLAMSLWNDDASKALADSFGAVLLLDKTCLTNQLIPAIKRYAT